MQRQPLSVRLIRETHAKLLHGGRGSRLAPGELRRSQNWIGPAGCSLAEAAFVPPSPDQVPQALGDLERFLHGGSDLPTLVSIGLAHAQFETFHPFLDGNGRIGWCERGILAKSLLYLSHYFKRHRAAYYDRVQAVRERGDWEGWLAFFLRGVDEVSSEAAETARRGGGDDRPASASALPLRPVRPALRRAAGSGARVTRGPNPTRAAADASWARESLLLQSKRLDQGGKRGWLLSSARIVEKVARERGAPALEHPHQLAGGDERRCVVLQGPDHADSVERSMSERRQGRNAR